MLSATDRQEPSMRGRTRCASCRKPLARLDDPFCSNRCCRKWYGCLVDPPPRSEVREDTMRCARCKRWLADSAFSIKRANPGRRFRTSFCKLCVKTRRPK